MDGVVIAHQGDATVSRVGSWLVCNCQTWNDVASLIVKARGNASLPFEMRTAACEHIVSAMKVAADARTSRLSGLTVVPLFWKIDLVSYATVFVSEEHQHGLAEVYSSGEMDNLPLVGFIDASEGRWAIRSMYLEWLRGVYPILPSCSGEYHGRTRAFGPLERKKLDMDTTNPEVLVEVHAMVEAGICRACASMDVSTLVPDI